MKFKVEVGFEQVIEDDLVSAVKKYISFYTDELFKNSKISSEEKRDFKNKMFEKVYLIAIQKYRMKKKVQIYSTNSLMQRYSKDTLRESGIADKIVNNNDMQFCILLSC